MRLIVTNAVRKYKQLPLPIKASGWIFVCNILQKAMQMLTVPIITRMLTAAEYGTYNVFTSWVNIVFILSSLKLSANGYYVAMKKFGEKSAYPSSVSGLSFLLLTVWFVVSVIFNKPLSSLTGLTSAMLILMFVHSYNDSAINLWYADNRYTYRYKMTVICTVFLVVFTPVLKIILIAVASHAGQDKTLATIWGLIIPKLLVGLVAWYAMFCRGRKLYIKEYWKFALLFNIPLIPYYMSQVILNQADRIMINSLDSATSAGLYSVAYALASVMQFTHAAINNGFIPWQFKTMQKGDSQKVQRVSTILTMIISVTYTLVVFCAPEIMRIFAAKEYSEAIYCIPPIVMGIFMQWIAQLFINVEFYCEKNKILSISSVVAAGLNIILNLIAIPKYGYIAAAYTTLICYTANAVFHAVIGIRLSMKTGLGSVFDIYRLVKVTIVSAVTIFAAILIYPYVIIRYIILCCVFLVFVINRKRLCEIVKETLLTIRKKSID